MPYLFEPDLKEPIDGVFVDVGGNKRFAPVDATDYLNVPGSGKPIGWGMGDGLRIRTDNVPTRVKLDVMPETLLDIWMFNSHWLLAEEVKLLIERLEPDTHQFFPIDVYPPDDGPALTRRYMINICNRLDSVDHDATPLVWSERPDGTPAFCKVDYYSYGEIAIRVGVVAGHHLWRDKWLAFGSSAGVGFCSDQLHNEVVDRGFIGMKFTQLNEV